MLCLAGCIEQSVVVKVNEDGSGIVHERVHSSLLFKDKEKKIIPSEADIAARAKNSVTASP